MGFLDKIKKGDINSGVKKCSKTPGALLVDVRQKEDYDNGHIPGSINIPESEINSITERVNNKNAPIFVYCLSGAKSWNARRILQSMGYTNVTDLGGINKYTGPKETSK